MQEKVRLNICEFRLIHSTDFLPHFAVRLQLVWCAGSHPILPVCSLRLFVAVGIAYHHSIAHDMYKVLRKRSTLKVITIPRQSYIAQSIEANLLFGQRVS